MACYHSLKADQWYGVYESWKILPGLKGKIPGYFYKYLTNAVNLAKSNRDIPGLDLLSDRLLAAGLTNQAGSTARQLTVLALSNGNFHRAAAGALRIGFCGSRDNALNRLVQICKLAMALHRPWAAADSAEAMQTLQVPPAAAHWYNLIAGYALKQKRKHLLIHIAALLKDAGFESESSYWLKRAGKL